MKYDTRWKVMIMGSTIAIGGLVACWIQISLVPVLDWSMPLFWVGFALAGVGTGIAVVAAVVEHRP